jgi:hypothetical protein
MALNPTSEEIEANGNGTNAKAETRVAKALSSYVNGDAKAANNSVSMMLTLEPQTNSKSNKRRIALMIDANNPLGMASVMLHFDPKMIAIRNIANGDLFAGDKAPVINQLPTPDGIILTVMPPAGSFIKGNGALVYLEVEMLQKGESALSFDTNNARFIAADGRATFVQLLQDAVVK